MPLAGDLADDAEPRPGGRHGRLRDPHRHPGVPDDQRPRRRAAGWRAIYALAAVAAVLFAVLLYRAVPPLEPKTRMRYPALLASVAAVVARERTVRWTLVLGATGFAMFTMFWTALTFLLSGPPFDYSVSVIGLFGLAGLAGAVAAQRTGRLHDRGWSLPATGAALGAGPGLVSSSRRSRVAVVVLVLVVVVVLLDVAVQAFGILNQRGCSPSRTRRAAGSTPPTSPATSSGARSVRRRAAVLWSAGGWTAITVAGVAASLFALSVWAVGRRGALVVRRRPGAGRERQPGRPPSRRAADGDIDDVAAVAASRRRDYEAHQPRFWREADDALERHKAFLRGLVDAADHVFLVAGEPGSVSGFIVGRLLPAPRVRPWGPHLHGRRLRGRAAGRLGVARPAAAGRPCAIAGPEARYRWWSWPAGTTSPSARP